MFTVVAIMNIRGQRLIQKTPLSCQPGFSRNGHHVARVLHMGISPDPDRNADTSRCGKHSRSISEEQMLLQQGRFTCCRLVLVKPRETGLATVRL